jgi:rod shape-determining protein MreD
VKTAGGIIAIAVALALQTTLARFVIRGAAAVDLVLIVVVYVGLTSGPVTGLLTGTVAGLAQDALASGILGIGGLAKTVVGFIAGIVGTQFIVGQTISRLIVFFGATLVHALIVNGFQVLLDPRRFVPSYSATLSQGLANALVGVIAFQIVEGLPAVIERRRNNRSRVSLGRRL